MTYNHEADDAAHEQLNEIYETVHRVIEFETIAKGACPSCAMLNSGMGVLAAYLIRLGDSVEEAD